MHNKCDKIILVNFESQIWRKALQKDLNIFVAFYIILLMYTDVIVGMYHETINQLYLKWEGFRFTALLRCQN